jgi:hypothetical protein
MDEKIYEALSEIEDSLVGYGCLSLDELNNIAYPGFLGEVGNRIYDFGNIVFGRFDIVESKLVRSFIAKGFFEGDLD